MSEATGAEAQVGLEVPSVPATTAVVAESDPQLPRTTGTDSSESSIQCPTCGTPLSKDVAPSGAWSATTCPTCYPATTVAESNSLRSIGADPMTNTAPPTVNSTDYAYFNPLPGTTRGVSIPGHINEVAVVTLGKYTPSGAPFVPDDGKSPMETTYQAQNPAFSGTELYINDEDQELGTGEGLTPSQDALLAPHDPAGDNPADATGDTEGTPLGDDSAQQPHTMAAPTLTSPTAQHLSAAFTPPMDSDGYRITSYTVSLTSSDGGAPASETVTTSPASFAGLTTGKHYTATVYATNAEGNGAVSPASASVAVS